MTTEINQQILNELAINFEANVSKLQGNHLVQSLRRKAMETFLNRGFPTKHNEEYKYSSTEKLFRDDYKVVQKIASKNYSKADVEQYTIPTLNAINIVLINGIFNEDLSDVKSNENGLTILSLNKSFESQSEIVSQHYGKYLANNNDAFANLNLASANDGVFIFVNQNIAVEKPIHIINITDVDEAVFINPHHLIVVEKNASVNVFESFYTVQNSSKYILNTAAEISVGENARANYYKLQNENIDANQINTMQVWQAANSHFDTNVITIGGGWIRNNLNIELKGTNCETHLNGLQLLSGHQHVDNHTLVDHQMPHCESNQLYKGILNDKSTGVFNGKIYVQRDAQKTNAYQSSKNMLLSDDATINTKPQLEIYADDVKCSHGSTTGKIDTEALFYLKTRGIGEVAAKNLLLMAFAGDVTQTIANAAYREHIESLISNHLHIN